MRPGDLLEQRFRLVRVLGRGRSGSVWCARNELIDRPVAVKVLHRSLAADPERLQRFFQEARACGRVRHPAVVEVLDLGQGDDGTLFLVMELLEGETMASLLSRKGRLAPDEALALVIPLAHGLAAAHSHGILHRDLKPANIYLHKTPTGGLQPKILDFGISKILGTDVTATGVVLGTPSYMSPEQARGVPDLDARTDVWSLGVILYECLTGRLPFIAKEYRALVDEIIDKKHVLVDRLVPDVPAELARMVDDCLDKARERRMPSASAMAQRLTTVLRRRGRADLLADPEDEFSEGAPTLTADREMMKAAAIDDTVGDHQALPSSEVPHLTEKASTTISPGRPSQDDDKIRTSLGIQPSAVTAFLASQTAGSKRQQGWTAPRPAAGKPAQKPPAERPESEAETPNSKPPVAPRAAKDAPKDPDETQPPRDRPPADDAAPLPSQGGSTHSWEAKAAAAASGRAEVILGRGGARASESKMVVDGDWDTTVADVSRDEMEKGPLPALLPKGPPKAPAVTDPPPASPAKPALGRLNTGAETPAARKSIPPAAPRLESKLDPKLESKDAAPKKLGASLASIPGFTAAGPKVQVQAQTPAPQQARAPQPTQRSLSSRPPPRGVPTKSQPPPPPKSRPPPPPAHTKPPANAEPRLPGPPRAPALLPQAAAPTPDPPPRKSVPPRPPPKVSRNTLRPSGDFGAPATPDMMAPRPPSGDLLLAPELLALGDAPIVETSSPISAPRDEQPPPSDAAATISREDTPDVVLETDRHTRDAPSIAPVMLTAAAVFFVFGGLLGILAANRRVPTTHARHFATQVGVIALWHLEAEKLGDEEAKIERDKALAVKLAKEKADKDKADKDKAEKDKAAAEAKAKEDEAAAAASASASASAAAKNPPKPPPKPPVAGPKPKPVAKPVAKPKDDPPKKEGNKDWWQKKF